MIILSAALFTIAENIALYYYLIVIPLKLIKHGVRFILYVVGFILSILICFAVCTVVYQVLMNNSEENPNFLTDEVTKVS
mmetsp:Transcript_6165/g.5555  ORF Transcript_6165/g.5555 Transcript_6165/m.5555 type:complete len:80 (+) Transcript_6165:124-363(+)